MKYQGILIPKYFILRYQLHFMKIGLNKQKMHLSKLQKSKEMEIELNKQKIKKISIKQLKLIQVYKVLETTRSKSLFSNMQIKL